MRKKSIQSLGFTLLEQVIIIAVLGILAALVVPNIMRMMERAKLDQAIAEIQGALNETQGEALRGNKVCDLTLNLVAGAIEGPCLITGHRRISNDLAIATNLIQAVNQTALPTAVVHAHPSVVPGLSVPRSQFALRGVSDLGMPLWRVDNGQPIKVAMGLEPPTPYRSAAIRFRIISHQSLGQAVHYQWILAHHKEGKGSSPPPSPDLPPPGPTVGFPIQFGTLGNPKFDIESNTSVPTDPSAKIVLYLPDNPTIPKKCVAISNSLGLIRIGRYEGPTTPAEITDMGTCKAENWQNQ